uniref:C2H2-type domain-containing protein n=1 Tax=Panagrolaimus superbus TaxID=310955 RepID=A0A914YXA0_9BILA
MQHLKGRHSLTHDIPCVLCGTFYVTAKTYQEHLRAKHIDGNINGPFLPPNWEEYQRNATPPVPAPAVMNEPLLYDEEADVLEFDFDMEPFDGEEEIPHNEEMPAVEPDDEFDARFEPFLESCFNDWLEFLRHPDATVKSADLFCQKLMIQVRKAFHLAQPYLPHQEAYRIESMVKHKFTPFSTEHRRRRHLENLGLYAKPEEYLTNIQQYFTGTPGGNVYRERRNLVAVIPIEKTLKAVLSIESLADSLVMPSEFTNSPTLCHPFAGRRAQSLLNSVGEDCLLVELYMDEFTTTCPIGNTSAVYKMAAIYIRLLNFPLDMLSQLDHIMLASLSHAVDVMGDLQEILRMVLIPQLKRLETDGITFTYRGAVRNFKVILYRLSADNLGFHQLIGFNKCFSGNNPCWMCRETAESLRTLWNLNPQRLRTRGQYDNLIANGTPEQRLHYGIKEPCCLNELQHFHCMEVFSVDYMHDLHEGHFLRLLPMVFRDAIAAGFTLNAINGAIAGFGPINDDGNNPLRPIFLPAQVPENGETLTGYTAKTTGVLVRLLPLMFKFAGIRLQTPLWQIFMKLQRIIDILYAPDVTDAIIDMFDTLVKSYLKDYIKIGGKMTVKPHKLLHYKEIMKEMGPLRHLATFRYEAKHHHFKQYAHVNRCFKNLQTTLADKNELMFAYTLMQMKARKLFIFKF